MKILMTGSTGFTGKYLVRMLEDSNCGIWHLVRNKKGFKNELIWDFKGPLPVGIPKCDVIVHLAAHVDFGLDFDIEPYNVNTVSTLRLSAYAKAHNAYFILASTVGIHGSKHAQISKDTPVAPENHYAVSKYLAEQVVQTVVNDSCILRISGIYGLDGPDHLGLNRAINEVFYRKKPPSLMGSGKIRRNYICVTDVARWILHLLMQRSGDKECTGKERGNKILYLAGTEVLSIEKYLKTIVDVLLPGKKLIRLEGQSGHNNFVSASSAPFALTGFREYLQSLRR